MRRGSYWGAGMVTPVNTAIILINIAVYIWLLSGGNPGDAQYMYHHGADFWPDVVYRGQYYRLLTCAFVHFSFSHILNNMLVLAFIGDNMERALVSVRYAIFYLLAAIGASAVSDAWYMYRGENTISGGASGAIFGIVGGMIVILLRNRGRLEDLSLKQVLLFAAFSIYYGVSSVGTDNAAHIGGAAVGALLALILYRKNRRRRPGR